MTGPGAVVPSPPAWAEARPDPPLASVPAPSRAFGRVLLAMADRIWGAPHPLAGRGLEELQEREGRFFRECWAAYFSPSANPRGSLALDLGCGRGAKTVELGRMGTALVVGVDREFGMLKLARESLERAGIRYALVQADAAHLPFREGVFGTVLCTDTVEHLHRLEEGVGEMGRVLSPRGAACVSFAAWPSAQGAHLGNYTTLPWCHLLVPHPLLLARIRERTSRLAACAGPDEAAALRHVGAWERHHFLHCLPRVTLARFEAACVRSGLAAVSLVRASSWWLKPLAYLPWWADRMTREQFAVLRHGGTGRPFSLRRPIAGDLRRIWRALGRRLGG